MKKLLFILLCCLFCSIKVQAQIPCEFDSTYSIQNNEAGYRLLECKTGGFLLLQMNGHRSSVEADYPVFAITKTDNCGKRIWTTKLDSSQCDAFKPCAKVLNLIEDENGNIECAAYYTAWTITKRAVLLFKTDNNGIMLRKTKVKLDSNLYYNINTFIKINSNRYLFTGSVAGFNTPNKPVAFAAMSDTLGNVIFYNRYFSDTTLRSKLSNAYQMNSNLILLFGHEDSVLTITKIDTAGNVLNLKKIPMQKPVSLEFNNPTLSYDSSSFFTYKSGAYNFGKYTLNGSLIKETNIPTAIQCIGFSNNPVDYIPMTSIEKSSLIIPNGSVLFVIDSALNVVKKDTFNYCLYHAIKTKDSCITAIGSKVYTTPTNLQAQLTLNKTSLKIYAKSIVISGQGTINQNAGSIQLTAIISPANTENKTIAWNISDTNLASITQTGLVTARANGIATVLAKSKDGSNITGSKNITITNQGVGLNQISEKNVDVLIHPNPASDLINIQSSSIKIHTVYLTDISGKVLYSNNNALSINIEEYTNGIYILKFETDEGVVFKKLIINK